MPQFRIELDGATTGGSAISLSFVRRFANVHEARKLAWQCVPAVAGEYVCKLFCRTQVGWVARKGFTAVVTSLEKGERGTSVPRVR